ncbi:yecA family protein [Neisseria meningitidis]|nr:yecA family protein [Neisseria meningitidis]
MDSRKFTEASKRRLSELLDAKSEQGNTMRCDEVQGFMTALLSGPDKLTPLDWLPEVLGDESQFTAAERSEIERLVLAMAMETTAAMSDKKLPDLWLYENEDGGSDFYTWCNAYLYGLDIVPTDWFEAVDDEAFEELFYPIMALGGIYDEEDNGTIRLQFTEGELAELESELPYALADITATGRRSSTSRKPSAGKAKKQAGTIPVRAAAAENTRRVAVRIEAFVSMNQT